MWVRAFGRAVAASAMAAVLVTACSGSPTAKGPTSAGGGTKTVKPDAKYTESTLPIQLRSFATAVAPNGDLYLSTQEGLQSLPSGAGEPHVVVPDLPVGFGLVATETRVILGSANTLKVVDLKTKVSSDVQVNDLEEIRGIALDREDNVYIVGTVTGDNGFPTGRVVKLNHDLSAPTILPFPGGPGYADIGVGPDGAVYVVNAVMNEATVLHPGDPEPSNLTLSGANGPVRLGFTPSGDMLVIDNDDPGHSSTSAQPMRLLRYPSGSTSPIQLASYKTDAYFAGGDAAGNVYYSAADGDNVRMLKLGPQP
ncbi:MAG: hypothetical protein QOH57_1761 [Mycobacterium sp.]|nr:hypothetical protein [Mycobacterium sp.]